MTAQRNFFCLILASVLLVAPQIVFAHDGASLPYGSFLGGLTHPVLGLDHFLAMVSVGVLSAQVGGRAIWTIPATFVVIMAFGGLLGFFYVCLSAIEVGIAFLLFVLGGTVALDTKGSMVFILFAVAISPDSLSTFQISLSEYTRYITFGIIAWTILVLLSAFTVWTHYYLDLWIITDRRIILVDQIHFFNRNVSIFRLERMQDIEFYVKGIIPTLLNFGTLKAQTAGAHESNFKSTGLPDPRGLQSIIQKAMDERLKTLHVDPQLTE